MNLPPGQAIVEYDGPRLPLRLLKHSTYALEVPDGSRTFIDGNLEHGNASGLARSLAIFANHSRLPNCSLQHWPSKSGPDMMWIVAKETTKAGVEARAPSPLTTYSHVSTSPHLPPNMYLRQLLYC